MKTAKPGPRLPNKPCLTLDVVKVIAAAAHAEATSNKWNVSIAIVDDGANLLYLERLDGAHVASAAIAQGKASTAMRYRRPSGALEDAINKGRTAFAALQGITPLQGAVPIVYDGVMVGAIGVSGVLASQDEQIALVGANVLKPMG